MGENIFITGGGRGLGLALVQEYLAHGDRVLTTVRAVDQAERLLSLGAQVLVTELADADCEARIGAGLKAFLRVGRLDVVINNAAMLKGAATRPRDLSADTLLDTFRINTLAPLRVVQVALPFLLGAKRPRAVAVSSLSGASWTSGVDRVAYRISKAGLNKLIQCLAMDLAGEGVVVAAVSPGWMRTDMGGPNAQIDPASSAAAIRVLVEKLDAEANGKLLSHDGAVEAW